MESRVYAQRVVLPNGIPSYANLCEEIREACGHNPRAGSRVRTSLALRPLRSCHLLPLTRLKVCSFRQGYLTFFFPPETLNFKDVKFADLYEVDPWVDFVL